MTQHQQKILITIAVALILGGAGLNHFSSQKGGGGDSVVITEAWTDGPPKMLIYEDTEKRGVNTGIAINSGIWRDPFHKLGGKIIHFDPTDDQGQDTDIKGKQPWFDNAMKRVRKDLMPYYVFAYKGRVSVGQIKDTEQGVADFEAKIVKLLSK